MNINEYADQAELDGLKDELNRALKTIREIHDYAEQTDPAWYDKVQEITDSNKIYAWAEV